MFFSHSITSRPPKRTAFAAVLAGLAALLDFFAQRTGQPAPAWASAISGLPAARFLLRSAATPKRLRRMCEEESPGPLKRRNLFAPADYLWFA